MILSFLQAATRANRVGAILALCLFLGCARADKGPLFLSPDAGMISASRIYSMEGEKIVFIDKALRVSVALIKDADAAMPQTIKRLHEKGNIIVSMEIENNSEHKVLFDPAHVAIMYDNGDSIDRPLDYTDIFEQIVGKREDAELEAEEEMRGIKDSYYYLPLTIGQGMKEEKLLIFNALPQAHKAASITIKELYIGRQSIDIAFPFTLKALLP